MLSFIAVSSYALCRAKSIVRQTIPIKGIRTVSDQESHYGIDFETEKALLNPLGDFGIF